MKWSWKLWVALAGPAVNVVIAAAIFVVIQVASVSTPLEQLGLAEGPFLERLMVVNIISVVFNMLPAFPMDGGRVLRALLATRIGCHIGNPLYLNGDADDVGAL